MSSWTHVNGIFRIDNIRPLIPDPDFTEIFGKVCTYESLGDFEYESESCPENFLPFGSEGSCNISVWINPDVSDMAAYTVSVFGDLRDYDETELIIDWFINVLRKIKDYSIRQAVITAESEWNGQTQIVTFANDNEVRIVKYDKYGTIVETNTMEI